MDNQSSTKFFSAKKTTDNPQQRADNDEASLLHLDNESIRWFIQTLFDVQQIITGASATAHEQINIILNACTNRLKNYSVEITQNMMAGENIDIESSRQTISAYKFILAKLRNCIRALTENDNTITIAESEEEITELSAQLERAFAPATNSRC